MGASGDMIMGSLFELLEDKELFLEKINSLGLKNVKVLANESIKSGISGTNMSVIIDGEQELSEDVDLGHHHHHDHSHEDHHHHDHEESCCGHEHHHHEHGQGECCGNHGKDHECHEHSHDNKHSHDHEHTHDHEHSHGHSHSHEDGGHHHNTFIDVSSIIKSLDIDEKVKKDAIGVYEILAEAESKAHNKPMTDVHFHEVGSLDAIYDIVGACMLMNMLNADRVIASSINVGSGHIKCAHGLMPVPAPATANILKNVPFYTSSIKAELCTPTGAAILKYFVESFENMPVMNVEKIGYGMGKKDFEAANAVRTFIGSSQTQGERVFQLEASMDDITGEEIGFLYEILLENKALEVFTSSIMMKKNRPGVLLTVLVREADKEEIINLIFKHTSTIGIKEFELKRHKLERTEEVVSSELGDVRKKVSSGFGVRREKLEFEDLKKLAKENNLSLREVKNRVK